MALLLLSPGLNPWHWQSLICQPPEHAVSPAKGRLVEASYRCFYDRTQWASDTARVAASVQQGAQRSASTDHLEWLTVATLDYLGLPRAVPRPWWGG